MNTGGNQTRIFLFVRRFLLAAMFAGVWGCTTGVARTDDDKGGAPPEDETLAAEEAMILDILDDNAATPIFNPRVIVVFDENDCPVYTRFKANYGTATGNQFILPTGLPITLTNISSIRWVGIQRRTPTTTNPRKWKRFLEPYAVYFSPMSGHTPLVANSNGVVNRNLLPENKLPVDVEFKYSIVRLRDDGQGGLEVYEPGDTGYCPALDPRFRLIK